MRPVLLDLWVDIIRTDTTDVRMYISHCPSIDCSKGFNRGGLFMDYKKEIIELLNKLDERKLILVFWHIKGLLGLK